MPSGAYGSSGAYDSPPIARSPSGSRPSTADSSGPRTVYCRFNVLEMHDIDAKNLTVKALLYYELAWELAECDQLTDAADDVDHSPSDWNKEWDPKVALYDHVGELSPQREAWNVIGWIEGKRMAFRRWIVQGAQRSAVQRLLLLLPSLSSLQPSSISVPQA